MIRVVDAQKLNGVVSITVERRHWYWPWLRRREYIAKDRRNRETYSFISDLLDALMSDSYNWINPTTGEPVSDALAIKLTSAFLDFERRLELLRRLEQGYDNVISFEDKKRKDA